MTHEVPQEVDVGEQRRARLMRPGEVFMGNWRNLSKDPFLSMMEDFVPPGRLYTRRAPQVIRDCEASGLYALVRTIPAYTVDGKRISGAVGIVVKPKSAL